MSNCVNYFTELFVGGDFVGGDFVGSEMTENHGNILLGATRLAEGGGETILIFFLYGTEKRQIKGDVTQDDLQRRFSAQHSVAILKQSCNPSKQCRANAVMLC